MVFSSLLKPGSPAPDFRLLSQAGRSLGLADCAGPNGLVLLFFAWDGFAGDRRMLKDFAEAAPVLQQAGLNVAGISALNWETLYNLSRDLNLPYPLLFDACARVSTSYRAMLIPRFVTGRAVYLLDAQGGILKACGRMTPQDCLG